MTLTRYVHSTHERKIDTVTMFTVFAWLNSERSRIRIALGLLCLASMILCGCRYIDERAQVTLFDGKEFHYAHARIVADRLVALSTTTMSLIAADDRTVFRGRPASNSSSAFLRPLGGRSAAAWDVGPEPTEWKLLCIDPPCFVRIVVDRGIASEWLELSNFRHLTQLQRVNYYFFGRLGYSFMSRDDLHSRVVEVKICDSQLAESCVVSSHLCWASSDLGVTVLALTEQGVFLECLRTRTGGVAP